MDARYFTYYEPPRGWLVGPWVLAWASNLLLLPLSIVAFSSMLGHYPVRTLLPVLILMLTITVVNLGALLSERYKANMVLRLLACAVNAALVLYTLLTSRFPGATGWMLLVIAFVAVNLLGIFAKRKSPPIGCCQNCSYDMRGNTTGYCPECGQTIIVRHSAI